MNSLIKLLRFITLTAVLAIVAGEAYTQTDAEIVSYFVHETMDIKANQTAFNVYRVENRTDYPQKVQVNFTLPVDWLLFGERTHFLTLPPHQKVNIPLRIAPSLDAKGGVGYALNAQLLSMDGKSFAYKYCFLHVPVRTDLKINFKNLSYYLDHRYGRATTELKIKNDGNSQQTMGIKLHCDERIDFTDLGHSTYNAEVTLDPGKDTTIRTQIKFNDMIENINYFNQSLKAEIEVPDTTIYRYSIIRYLDYRHDNYIDESEQPLVLEVSALDLLSENVTFRVLALGKIKFKDSRSISYMYRSIPAKIQNLPDWKYDEYYIKYQSPKTMLQAGNLRDDYSLSLFGPGVKAAQLVSPKTTVSAGFLDDIYSRNYQADASVKTRIRNIYLTGNYIKMISDTNGSQYMDMYGLGTRFSMGRAGYINFYGAYNTYLSSQYSGLDGYNIDASYTNTIGKASMSAYYRMGTPYAATYNHGREELYTNLSIPVDKRSFITAGYNRYKHNPASIYNDWSTDLNYTYHTTRLLYNYTLALNSMIYAGPNYDYGTSNYYYNSRVDMLKLQSIKAEIGYRFAPNLYALQALSLNMQIGKVIPIRYCDYLASPNTATSNVMKFSATIQGKRWGAYGMYYSGLYNMSMALSNFYTTTSGRYLYFMPYFRITSANKRLYYEIRFSYLNNLDLRNTRTSIIQEAGANLGHGWSMRVMNNTNMQALQDASGQSYRYTNNYMEFTVRKVFGWNQPGQKYHNLHAVFYRDLNGDHRKSVNEPEVENVIVGIQNNSALDTSYHYRGEMFGNVDLASNHKGFIEYNNIPEAQYYISYKPSDYDNERYILPDNGQLVDLNEDKTIYIPFVERNVVFGVVKFNRSKRSSIQDIKLDGIKIQITDSEGKSYSALTDQNGYYEIYAPVADFYKVELVNNVWSDFFDLKQNMYRIKFNGYKRFEVNFEFDERKREIHFDDVVEIDDLVSGENFKFEDVKALQQSILRGSVTDEKSLEPIKAKVEIIDVDRHETIVKMFSSSTDGSFFTTFMTGKNYQLKITADGYWGHQELLTDDQITTFETIDREGLMLKRIGVGKEYDIRNLTFDTNSNDLTPEGKAELENFVTLLHNNTGVKINIVGYADKQEHQASQLADKRAKAVMQFITQRGIPASRITIEAKTSDGAKCAKIIITSNK